MEADHANDVDVKRIGSALWRRRWWVIAPTLLGLIVALVFVNVVPPRYTADTRVLLENQENYLTGSEKSQRGEISAPDAEAVQSQLHLLTSRDLARRAIKTLELQGDVEFDPLAKGFGPVKRLLVMLGITRDPTLMLPEDRVLEKFAERLSVLSPTKTRVLTIEFSSENPDLAARAANVVADTYLDMQMDAKREVARAAGQSLSTLVADLKGRLAEAEARVEEFRSKTGLLMGSNNTVITTQQLGELNNQLSQARAHQADAQAKARLLRDMLKQGRIGDVPDISNNEVIRRIYEQRVSLRGQLALESRTLLPMHPRIKELSAQLADLDAQWRAAAERTARTLENDARIARARVDNLMRELDSQKLVASAAGADEVQLRELERAARVLKERFDAESIKYQEAVARERQKATPADARVIQRALAPQFPSFPKKGPIVVFATMAGLILSAGAIIAGELLSGRARPAQQPERVSVVGGEDAFSRRAELISAPENSVGPPAGIAPSQATTVTSFAQSAVVKIDHARISAASVKVLVTPCLSQGKEAESAIALGRNLARRGRTLLVAVDAGPAIYDGLVAAPSSPALKGFSELLAGECEFSDAIYRDGSSRMQIMPGGASTQDARYDVALIVNALAHTYDFVVLAASAGAARRLAALVDMAFVVGGEDAAALRDELGLTTDAFLLEEGVSADDLVAA